MADILPAFPLAIVPFPEEYINLHIFEPRYKQLINECVQKGTSFCIVPHVEGKLKNIATEMRVSQIVKKYANGEMDIRTEAIGIVEVVDFYEQLDHKLYPAVAYEKKEWVMDDVDVDVAKEIVSNMKILHELLGIEGPIPKDMDNFAISQIIHKIGLSVNQEVVILGISPESKRQEFLLERMKALIPLLKEIEEIRVRASMNGEFRKLDSI